MDNALTIIKSIKGGFAAGVSGGADSMCLLSLVLKAGRGGDCTVINVDHGIRENSALDSLFVRDFCIKNGVKFVGHKVDVPAAALLSGRSTETEARIMRHGIFNGFCKEHNVPLLLAHNKGDNAESILMHIFRGCGIRGLTGMTERDGNIIRPLIHLEKAEICGYLQQNGIPHVEDETNSDLHYSRNRVRALIAEAEKSFGGARGAIVSLAKIAGDTLDFIRSQLDESFFMRRDGAVLLDKRALDGFLAGYYVINAASLAGLNVDLEQKHIAAVVALAGLQVGKSIDLPHGLRVFNRHDALEFEFFSSPAASSAPDTSLAVAFDNDYGMQGFGAAKIRVLSVDYAALNGGYRQKGRLFVDLDRLCGAELRLRREGDRFWACGGRGKKLKEFFNEKRVPLRLRDRLPLIALNGEVLVVLGLRVSEKVKITTETTRPAEIVLDWD